MQKLRDLIGLPVLDVETGTQIGEVHEVVLDINRAVVCGIVISGAAWFSQDRGILFHDLYRIGRDAVMVHGPEAVREFAALLAAPGSHKLREFTGKQIYTESGNYLGVLVDIACMPETGEIRFLELSDGLLTDFLYGRLLMPLPQAQVINDDKMIVPEAMAKLLHAANIEPGGVK
jgi:uncharacterized protein YrrD